MGQLSSRLLVSNGNVTGLVARLEAEGYVSRIADATDRRTFYVALTPRGQRDFDQLAAAHEGWIEDMFQSLGTGEIAAMMEGLERIKSALAEARPGDAR